MKYFVTLIIGVFAMTINAASLRQILLDDQWRFSLDADDSALACDYDDSKWRVLDLPHDWSVEGAFDVNAPMGNEGGYLPSGVGYYRKRLENLERGSYRIYFEGVYMNSELWVNGHKVGGRPYGYSSYFYDITPYLSFDGTDLVAVKVDNSAHVNCRWYAGSGIYRHVWLSKYGNAEIEPWGLHIKPQVKDGRAEIDIDYGVRSNVKHPVMAKIECAGKTVKNMIHKEGRQHGRIIIEEPRLWSPSEPNLYDVRISLFYDGEVIDSLTEQFGIRKFEYSSRGATLNGDSIKLNGACVHHDHGILGVRSYDAAEARKVRLLKDAGFNAVRCSHNIPSEAFLYECDRQGLMVIDEAFDGWYVAKTSSDYAQYIGEWWAKDLESMVLRDRNHPSVIAWSVGNEIWDVVCDETLQHASEFHDFCTANDGTRPVTFSLFSWDPEWSSYDPLAAKAEIIGYNYMIDSVASDHKRVPDRVVWQTESFPNKIFAYWKLMNETPCYIGDFVWTGIDYLGESGLGRHFYTGERSGEPHEGKQWPYHGSLSGDIDILGQRKPRSYYRDMLHNRQDGIWLYIREPDGYYGEINVTKWGDYPVSYNWSWPGHEGKPIDVEVVSLSPTVALYLNDIKIAEKNNGIENEYKVAFTVPYAPGKLYARDASGNISNVLVTSKKPKSIRLSVERDSISADNQDLCYVTAEIVDVDGNFVYDNGTEITFLVDGEGVLLASGNDDLSDTKSYSSSVRRVNNGRVLAVVKSTHRSGQITIHASSPHVDNASVTVTAY